MGGDCTDDEINDPVSGDALQHTVNGLLVWRKADNWTAFTDGSQTWVNGPLGLEQRFHEQRFWWEANPQRLEITPPPRPGERCHTAGLSLSLDGIDAGAGNRFGTFRLSNEPDVACTFFGYPGAQLLDSYGAPVETTVVWSNRFFSSDLPMEVRVAPHGSATFHVHWEVIEVGNETMCSMGQQLAVTPPDEYVPLVVEVQIRACGHGELDISAIQPVEVRSSMRGD